MIVFSGTVEFEGMLSDWELLLIYASWGSTLVVSVSIKMEQLKSLFFHKWFYIQPKKNYQVLFGWLPLMTMKSLQDLFFIIALIPAMRTSMYILKRGYFYPIRTRGCVLSHYLCFSSSWKRSKSGKHYQQFLAFLVRVDLFRGESQALPKKKKQPICIVKNTAIIPNLNMDSPHD